MCDNSCFSHIHYVTSVMVKYKYMGIDLAAQKKQPDEVKIV